MKIAFIGMGTMGAPMALNLLKAGYDVTVHNRTRAKEAPVAEQGAQRASSPSEAALEADIIITCVSDTPDVEAVILGEDGVIHGARQDSIVVDMSTVSPTATRIIAEALSQKGVQMLDAPVSGGSEGAQKGTLAIMAGGDETAFEKVKPVLQAMGTTIMLIGPVGSGQMTKAINQTVIAGVYQSVAEGMALGLKAGLDMEKVIKVVGGGAAGSWVMDNRADFMVKNNYPLGFKVQLHRKDLVIALNAARELGVPLPVAAYVEQIENGLIVRGYGDEDVSAMARCIREASGIDS
ncbi:NAD(P)-dependent oxidoreductase [Desulfococcaceae bacterium HSG9]|nr:NAD(P)-dependent oxidoreductase [Desulfococcaceae bacterium HSG9]